MFSIGRVQIADLKNLIALSNYFFLCSKRVLSDTFSKLFGSPYLEYTALDQIRCFESHLSCRGGVSGGSSFFFLYGGTCDFAPQSLLTAIDE